MSERDEPLQPATPAEASHHARHAKRRDGVSAGRHRARVLALQALYEADTAGHDPASTIIRLVEDERVPSPAAAYARALIDGIKASRETLDAHIQRSASQWPLEQLAAVDRNILRIAIYEMLIEHETPVRVAVNEAVELAKEFGSDTSPRFVNGVLGTLSALRQEP